MREAWSVTSVPCIIVSQHQSRNTKNAKIEGYWVIPRYWAHHHITYTMANWLYTLADTLHMLSSILSQRACFSVCDIWYRFVYVIMRGLKHYLWDILCLGLHTEHRAHHCGYPSADRLSLEYIISWPMYCPWYNRNMLPMGWHTDDGSHTSWPTCYWPYTSYVLVMGCYSRYAI